MKNVKIKAHHGFSVAETVIVVAIMAILASLAAPAFIQFLDSKTAQEEANNMQEIRKALAVFSEDYGFLPFDDGDATTINNAVCGTDATHVYTWAECLALSSNLSPQQIATDAWGNARAYTMFQDSSATASYIGASITRHYAAVFSRGVDQNAETQAGVATEVSTATNYIEYSSATDSDWWNKSGSTANKITAYNSLEALEDDLFVRYSDVELKRKQYEITLERIQKINEALKSYSSAQYNLAVSNNETNANTRTYYPLSRADVTGGDEVDIWTNYGEQVRNDMTTSMFGGDRHIENRIGTTYEATRLTEMQNLMKVLGLPDSYCCNAMERMSNDPEQEMPLFYYSNPRAQTGSGTCVSTRASEGDAAPLYLPPKIQVESYACP